MLTTKRRKHLAFFFLAATFVMLTWSTAALASVKGTFLYNLSNFAGTLPYEWVRIHADPKNNEVYVINSSNATVRIFNDAGMAVFMFGEDGTFGGINDVAVNNEGDIFVLSVNTDSAGRKYSIIRCNYRGEPVSSVQMKNIPPEFSDFVPGRLFYREGLLYLPNLGRMKVLVIEENGNFKESYDLAALLNLGEKERDEIEIFGFSVDREGNMFFTIPVLFNAYKVTPGRKISSFGKKGSQPGRFGIISGIATDNRGYIYVVDTLRCVVMIFDKNFKFETEFGYRGLRPGSLIAPREVETDGKGNVYVNQARKRGVSVYRITYD
jgi:DNA-binding beta-propeller fold protein YncE